jgi:hypothetical protein
MLGPTKLGQRRSPDRRNFPCVQRDCRAVQPKCSVNAAEGRSNADWHRNSALRSPWFAQLDALSSWHRGCQRGCHRINYRARSQAPRLCEAATRRDAELPPSTQGPRDAVPAPHRSTRSPPWVSPDGPSVSPDRANGKRCPVGFPGSTSPNPSHWTAAGGSTGASLSKPHDSAGLLRVVLERRAWPVLA